MSYVIDGLSVFSKFICPIIPSILKIITHNEHTYD